MSEKAENLLILHRPPPRFFRSLAILAAYLTRNEFTVAQYGEESLGSDEMIGSPSETTTALVFILARLGEVLVKSFRTNSRRSVDGGGGGAARRLPLALGFSLALHTDLPLPPLSLWVRVSRSASLLRLTLLLLPTDKSLRSVFPTIPHRSANALH